MMQSVVEHGTGTAVRAVGKPIAGKTGTTNDFRDAWFLGGTPNLVAGVFIGYDDPDSLGDDETGGHIAAPVFRDFMITALKDAPATAFHAPSGLRLYRVNPSTGVQVAEGGVGDLRGLQAGDRAGHEPKLGPSERARRGSYPIDEQRSPVAPGACGRRSGDRNGWPLLSSISMHSE